jgi:hypothetical protein
MAREIITSIRINSQPENVWAILSNFNNYPTWNPFIKSIKGTVEKGNKISVQITPPNAKEMTFTPKVLAFEKNKEFRWLGHLFIPGIFDGEHKFELKLNEDGTTNFIHSEKFRGILVPFLKKMLETTTKKGFESMNEKIKEMAERKTL